MHICQKKGLHLDPQLLLDKSPISVVEETGSYPLYPESPYMLRLSRCLVRSKLDYGCIVYASARKSYMQMMDPVHQGPRLCLGGISNFSCRELVC